MTMIKHTKEEVIELCHHYVGKRICVRTLQRQLQKFYGVKTKLVRTPEEDQTSEFYDTDWSYTFEILPGLAHELRESYLNGDYSRRKIAHEKMKGYEETSLDFSYLPLKKKGWILITSAYRNY